MQMLHWCNLVNDAIRPRMWQAYLRIVASHTEAQTHGWYAEVQQCSHEPRKDKLHTGCCIVKWLQMRECALEPTAATDTGSNYCSTVLGVTVPLSHTVCCNICQIFTMQHNLVQYEPAAPSDRRHIIIKASWIESSHPPNIFTARYHWYCCWLHASSFGISCSNSCCAWQRMQHVTETRILHVWTHVKTRPCLHHCQDK